MVLGLLLFAGICTWMGVYILKTVKNFATNNLHMMISMQGQIIFAIIIGIGIALAISCLGNAFFIIMAVLKMIILKIMSIF